MFQTQLCHFSAQRGTAPLRPLVLYPLNENTDNIKALQHPRIQRGRGNLLTPSSSRATSRVSVKQTLCYQSCFLGGKKKKSLKTTKSLNFQGLRREWRREGEGCGLEMKPKRKRVRSASGSSSQVRYQVKLCLEFWEDGSLA